MAGLQDALRGMGAARATVVIGVVVVLIAFFVMLAFRMSAGNMVPLYTNLSLEDSAKIVAELDRSSTPYQLTGNGTQIMVPADRVLRLRMSMAQEGLPSGGTMVGYEIFDRSESFGSSSFVMNVNMLRALEGELARTIGSLANVDTARVHLVTGKREMFSRDKDKPSASVTIKMRGGKSLESGEVTAIAHLVAAAVPQLEASRVTIVDTHGRLLARGDGDSMGATANASQEYRVAYENYMRQKLEELLEKIVGIGKARVEISADINFDRIVTNSEKFDPEGQVARSVQSTSQRENNKNNSGGDNVSVTTNLPGAAGGGGGNSSDEAREQADETTNYEISKTVQNHVREGGSINKISVAALIDGNYTEGNDGKQTYSPRNEEEIKQIKALISSAIGFDEKRGDKIEVVNMQFKASAEDLEGTSFFERFKLEMQSIIQTLIIAVVAILAILLVLRPAVTQLIRQTQSPSERVAGELGQLAAPASAGGAVGQLAAPAGGAAAGSGGGTGQEAPELMIDVANIKGGMKSSSMKKIGEIVEKYPEETMGVLRQWILKQS